MGIIIEFLPPQGIYSAAVDERYDGVMKAIDRVMVESAVEEMLSGSQFLIGALLRDRREKKP